MIASTVGREVGIRSLARPTTEKRCSPNGDAHSNTERIPTRAAPDVSFFTASPRVLKSWGRKGVVEKSRGKVIIQSPEKLLAA